MNSQTFNVFKLRGMDERWLAEVNSASLIIDMTWSGNDSWKDSGGYDQVWRSTYEYEVEDEYTPPDSPEREDEPPDENDTPEGDPRWAGTDEEKEDEEVDENDEEESDPPTTTSSTEKVVENYFHKPIHSIHWFSQHNGARQWTVFEAQTTRGQLETGSRLLLRAFDGTLVNSTDYEESTGRVPWRTLETFSSEKYLSGSDSIPLKPVDDRIGISVGITTQSETWGGKLYLVNGYNAPVVFNGEYVEIAGFSTEPPAPTAGAGLWSDGNTRIIGQGWTSSDTARSKFGRWREHSYSGMGPRGYSEYAAGSYRAFVAEGADGGGIYGSGRPEGDSSKTTEK